MPTDIKKYKDPFIHFEQWYQEAQNHKGIKEVNAISLATSTNDGCVSNRMVLLKHYSNRGFVFYTNLNSRKGSQIKQNPHAGMCLYWEPLGRQIRIEGKLESVSDEEADAYFATRDIQSRVGAWASKQSQILESKSKLITRIAKYTVSATTQNIERPDFWSGFRLVPNYIEFWERGNFRIHNRKLYTLKDGKWESNMLYP
jgi:pyridoxamine 5'-phosphate oxidase